MLYHVRVYTSCIASTNTAEYVLCTTDRYCHELAYSHLVVGKIEYVPNISAVLRLCQSDGIKRSHL